MRQNDHFGVGFDTFYDRRSGFMFYANPLGGFADYSVVDEGAPNTDWNPVWDVRTGRFDGGWTIEMQFPFKSLRYTSGADQVWGIQFRRSIRHKNEWTYWTPVPQNMAGPQALNRVSSFGTVVGLDLPPAGRNLELKPYALGKMTHRSADAIRRPSNDKDGDIGGDVKYGVTANLTADLTINTDFAQVEIDEQQVNLTRFNLFLPEKREFFLEGRGLFDFAPRRRVRRRQSRSVGGGSTDTPYLFYTRRIGLNRNRIMPIDAGGRLTGKVGAFGVGVMNIQAGDEEVSRDAVDQLHGGAPQARHPAPQHHRRDVHQSQRVERDARRHQPGLRRRRGARLLPERRDRRATTRSTETTGVTGDNESYQGKFDWSPDRYGVSAEVPEGGQGVQSGSRLPAPHRLHALVRLGALQPAAEVVALRAQVHLAGELRVLRERRRRRRVAPGRPAGSTSSSTTATSFNVEANANYDLLLTPFSPAAGSRDPGRRLSLQRRADVLQHGPAAAAVGQRRRAARRVLQRHDPGADASRQGRYAILKQFSVEPRMSINHVELPDERVHDQAVSARAPTTASRPRMFASALLQYSSADHTFSSNVRFRWEYRPGSEFFVVWTDEQDTNPLEPQRGNIALRNRAFVIKMTRLFRF